MIVRTKVSPTQRLRDLIDDSSIGQATTGDLHNALLELERELHLPLTEPDEDRD